MLVGEKKLWQSSAQDYGVADNYDIALSSNKVNDDEIKHHSTIFNKQNTGKHLWTNTQQIHLGSNVAPLAIFLIHVSLIKTELHMFFDKPPGIYEAMQIKKSTENMHIIIN